jgi:hypothetical protein
MIISDSLAIGQITFVLRVAIQILSYGGLALIGLIILGTVPRTTNVETHDVINRVLGASTVTASTATWIVSNLRQSKAAAPPTNLIAILFLFISYTAFAALSDVGFLGFYACSVPGNTYKDFPASVSSDETARTLIKSNIIRDVDSSKLLSYRCQSAETINLTDTIQQNQCTWWQNSTYADPAFFTGFNSTDSDVLMPRRLAKAGNGDPILQRYFIGPNTQRVTSPTIRNGLLISPHNNGVIAIVGVPQLSRDRTLNIEKTLAIELEVGCMKVGIDSQGVVNDDGFDIFHTNGNWRNYTGPEYLRAVLTNTTDVIREAFRPLFNTSTLDSEGHMSSTNRTNALLSPAALVRDWTFPNRDIFTSTNPGEYILGNCTEALKTSLGISMEKRYDGTMCGFYGIGGSLTVNDTLNAHFSRMVCASATQVNMVSAKVTSDSERRVSVDVTRIPSNLHHLRADYWRKRKIEALGDANAYINFGPYERFTLADSPSASSQHFIPHRDVPQTDNTLGLGSAGHAITGLGNAIFGPWGTLSSSVAYAGLPLLEDGFEQIEYTTDAVVRWIGEVGASYLSASIAYNGWAARASAPLEVQVTGGRVGACYKPLYALGFLPLILAAVVVVSWTVVMIARSSLLGSNRLKAAYGGMGPYTGVMVSEEISEKETLLTWEHDPRLHLQLVSKEAPVESDITALRYSKTGDRE